MEKLEPISSRSRPFGREKKNNGKRKTRSFQQRFASRFSTDKPVNDESVFPASPLVTEKKEGKKVERRVGGCIKARYEANHGTDGNKYFIASKTYHLPIERMNYSV